MSKNYDSIQDFLTANGFTFKEKDEAFWRDNTRIEAVDLIGKPLSYFEERYSKENEC